MRGIPQHSCFSASNWEVKFSSKCCRLSKGANLGNSLRVFQHQTGCGRGIFHGKCFSGQENASSAMLFDAQSSVIP